MPVKWPAARQPLVPQPPAMAAVEVDRAADEDMPVGLRDALSQYASGERLRRLQRAKRGVLLHPHVEADDAFRVVVSA